MTSGPRVDTSGQTGETPEGILNSVYMSYICGDLIFEDPPNKSDDSRNCNANLIRAYNSQVTPRGNV